MVDIAYDCSCCHVELGVVVIGAAEIVTAVAGFSFTATQVHIEDPLYTILLIVILSLLVLCTIAVMLMAVGVITRRPGLIIPHLAFQVLLVALSTGTVIIGIAVLTPDGALNDHYRYSRRASSSKLANGMATVWKSITIATTVLAIVQVWLITIVWDAYRSLRVGVGRSARDERK